MKPEPAFHGWVSFSLVASFNKFLVDAGFGASGENKLKETGGAGGDKAPACAGARREDAGGQAAC